MRSDLLSKRIFIAGCFGLPWLWIVHVLYHYRQELGETENQGLINPDDHFPDGSPASGHQLSAEDIQLETKKWVERCKKGAIVYTSIFVAWIVIAQLLQKSVLPASLYMLNSDDASVTGW